MGEHSNQAYATPRPSPAPSPAKAAGEVAGIRLAALPPLALNHIACSDLFPGV
jgi:hypothetical protein